MIYISHPFSGKFENKLKVEEIILNLNDLRPGFTYVSPIHAFCFMYDRYDYNTGMIMCLDLLSACDAMYVYGDYQNSRGCMIEIGFAKRMRIPVFYPEKGEYFTPLPYKEPEVADSIKRGLTEAIDYTLKRCID